MLKTILIALLPFLVFFSNGLQFSSFSGSADPARDGSNGTLEKLIVANGTISLDLNLNGNQKAGSKASRPSAVRFDAERDSFFTAIVFNNELRAVLPSMMAVVPQGQAALPGKLGTSYRELVIESLPIGGPYELAVRDKAGFVFFNVEGFVYEYDFNNRSLNVELGRLILTKEFAENLGRPGDAGSVAGQISIAATMRPIEITQVVDDQVTSNSMPAMNSPEAGTVPGPDVIVGDLSGLAQFGASSGTRVGLAVGTDSCNFGTIDLNWNAMPANDHPVIPQNLYRMSGGTANDERFEQIGQSSVKHAFEALALNLCSLGCRNSGTGSRLGSGCSDPYTASLNAGPNLGSRAWINPFTGAYPRGDSATNPNSHSGHSHNGTSHRILTEISDLLPANNPGATYYAEAQYVTPHEYAWCQSNPGQCNMYNNVSYRRFSVAGSGTSFSFAAAAPTERTKRAVTAWPGATMVEIKPDPGVDGVGVVAYKVTNPSPGVWHYEYAIFNEHLDRAIQSFSVPAGADVTLTNIGFHAPPQHPGSANDGTLGSAGFSSTPWPGTHAGGSITWATETLAQNPNANAIRWGTMYNFRFDSNRPPQATTATVGFFKTGAPITVQVQGPGGVVVATVSVSGRVSGSDGRALAKAQVSITDAGGVVRNAVTSPFGFYRFDNLPAGATYTIAAQSKRHTFTPRTMQIDANLTDVDFTAVP